MSPERFEDLTLEERLAAAGDADEVREILGKRRMGAYSAVFLAIALVCLGGCVYPVVAVLLGRMGPWTLLWLPAPLTLFLFFGAIAYADCYERVTGRRAAMTGFTRVVARLNTDI